jgi:hypothetical protein
MSRLLKMGVTAAGISLQDAGVEKPDAIITGTGLGMMEETEKFLNSMIENQERLLNPTAFIQSTHNTVGASIAVMLGCNNYNLTYVHGPVSFENALLDCLMWLEERPSDNVLLGGIEEITEDHFKVIDTFDLWKKEEVDSLNIFEDGRPGTLAGEGATFFTLSKTPGDRSYARIDGLSVQFNPDGDEILEDHINSFLGSKGLRIEDMDLVILGRNGDPASDGVYANAGDLLSGIPQAVYKHLCGEHYLSSSFALWLGARIAASQSSPEYPHP